MKRRYLESSDDRGNWRRASWHDIRIPTYMQLFGTKAVEQDNYPLWFAAKWASMCAGAALGLFIVILIFHH
jgi:hypothetical protein